LLFFSTPAGHAGFFARVRAGAANPAGRAQPEVVFDGEIPGPWSEYASVWRVVLRPVSAEFLADREDYFFW
jgi:hypothetical protein